MKIHMILLLHFHALIIWLCLRFLVTSQLLSSSSHLPFCLCRAALASSLVTLVKENKMTSCQFWGRITGTSKVAHHPLIQLIFVRVTLIVLSWLSARASYRLHAKLSHV